MAEIEIHVIDILLARYFGPQKRPDWYNGLAVYTVTFKSGQLFRNLAEFWLWVREYEQESGLHLLEIARGPSGCFDQLIELAPKDFDNGVHRDLTWSDPADHSAWMPPVDTKKIVCDRGSFVTLDVLSTLAPGFAYSSGIPQVPSDPSRPF